MANVPHSNQVSQRLKPRTKAMRPQRGMGGLTDAWSGPADDRFAIPASSEAAGRSSATRCCRH